MSNKMINNWADLSDDEKGSWMNFYSFQISRYAGRFFLLGKEYEGLPDINPMYERKTDEEAEKDIVMLWSDFCAVCEEYGFVYEQAKKLVLEQLSVMIASTGG